MLGMEPGLRAGWAGTLPTEPQPWDRVFFFFFTVMEPKLCRQRQKGLPGAGADEAGL